MTVSVWRILFITLDRAERFCLIAAHPRLEMSSPKVTSYSTMICVDVWLKPGTYTLKEERDLSLYVEGHSDGHLHVEHREMTGV